MPVIRHADTRRIETPNATMTTLASPTQGGFGQAVWRVDMTPGQVGPLHAMDTELLWAVLAGAATISIGAEQVTVGPGDAVVVPAGTPRQVSADRGAGFTALGVAAAGAQAYPLDGSPAAPAEATPAGDQVVPPWMT